MERITITIQNWKKWQPRSDLKRPTWFAFSNDLLDHPDFVDWSPLEFHALVYIFSQASKRNCATVDLVPNHAKLRNIDLETLLAAISKLTKLEVVSIKTDSRVRDRSCDPNVGREVTSTVPTATDITDRHNRQTNQTGELGGEFDNEFGPKQLAEIWNERMEHVRSWSGKPIPLVQIYRLRPNQSRWRHAKARLAEEPMREFWIDVVDRIARSEFCRGKDSRTGWVATFDFLLREKTAVAVMEGQYGCTPRKVQTPVGPIPVTTLPQTRDEKVSELSQVREQLAVMPVASPVRPALEMRERVLAQELGEGA